jgi:hypothetical protein
MPSYTVTNLTNGTEYEFRAAGIDACGVGNYSQSATGTPNIIPNALEFAGFFKGNASHADEYSVAGIGTDSNPLTAVVGGVEFCDNRLWLLINKTGTLSWSLSVSSEVSYDFARAVRTTGAPVQHIGGQSVPGTLTVLSESISGPSSRSGTLAVSQGQYVVLSFTKDDGVDHGADNTTLAMTIAD